MLTRKSTLLHIHRSGSRLLHHTAHRPSALHTPTTSLWRTQLQQHHYTLEQHSARSQPTLQARPSSSLTPRGTSGTHSPQRSALNPFITDHAGVNPATPLQYYHNLVDDGSLREDDHQTRIIQKLQRLHEELENYSPPPLPQATSEKSWARNSLY